jgi:hypothetical protein
MQEASNGETIKERIKALIEAYGYQRILADHNLTLWKALEILDDLGYIYLERYEDKE